MRQVAQVLKPSQTTKANLEYLQRMTEIQARFLEEHPPKQVPPKDFGSQKPLHPVTPLHPASSPSKVEMFVEDNGYKVRWRDIGAVALLAVALAQLIVEVMK